MSVPHHDGLFVDRVDDCLDEEIDGRTEDLLDAREDNPSEREWRGRGGHHDVPTKMWPLISETPRFHEIKNESGVISKGCFAIWIHQMIPLDMMMATLYLMLDIYGSGPRNCLQSHSNVSLGHNFLIVKCIISILHASYRAHQILQIHICLYLTLVDHMEK